jgi:hypothetical protein
MRKVLLTNTKKKTIPPARQTYLLQTSECVHKMAGNELHILKGRYVIVVKGARFKTTVATRTSLPYKI